MSVPSDFSPSQFQSSQPSLSELYEELPQSETDILEAIEATRTEHIQKLTQQGVVIQHRRAYSPLKKTFRSSSAIPETPTKSRSSAELDYEHLNKTLPLTSPLQPAPSSPPYLESKMENPFALEDDEDTVVIRNPIESSSTKDKLEEAFLNPFIFDEDEEEALKEASLPSSINAQISNHGSIFGGAENGKIKHTKDVTMPFTIDDLDEAAIDHVSSQTQGLKINRFATQSHSSTTQDAEPTLLPLPKANATSRVKMVSCSGNTFHVLQHPPFQVNYYRNSLASVDDDNDFDRPTDQARRKFFGIDIHQLGDTIRQDEEFAKLETERQTLQPAAPSLAINALINSTKVDPKTGKTLLWTEKYRAKRFTDLLGDERTHRHVLTWLKKWDSVVFPSTTSRPTKPTIDEPPLKKIMLLTGPPGLGKTTMAHVLARQAGYEPLEINASDDRSGDVVRNKIKDIVGMETVRMGDSKRGKPICLIVDEVDGVTGDGGGEGGFIKALVDLIVQDQKSSSIQSTNTNQRRKKKTEKFRFYRPIIAICNDLYAGSLRNLRPLAEVVYTRKPPPGLVVQRLKQIMGKEGIDADDDAIRRIVELEGASGRGSNEAKNSLNDWGGDVRGIMVAGEWICGRIRHAACTYRASKLDIGKNGRIRLSKRWVEDEMSSGAGLGANDGGGGGRGRGVGVRDVVEQVFIEHEHANSQMRAHGAQSLNTKPRPGSDASLGGGSMKGQHNNQLRSMVEATGEWDKVMSDCFATYPTQPFHDDPLLTKPNEAYEWLYFHDAMSSKVWGANQDYELIPYLSTPVLAFHHLFAVPASANLKGRKAFGAKRKAEEEEETMPFSGPKAEYESREALKANKAFLAHLLTVLPQNVVRAFKPIESIASELAPWLLQIVQPKVNPVVVGGKDSYGVASVRRDIEKKMVDRAVIVMTECGIAFERSKVEGDGFMNRGAGWIFRMEPQFETLTTFTTFVNDVPQLTTRYAVRQVLDQEHRKFVLQQQSDLRQAKFRAANPNAETDELLEKEKKKNISAEISLRKSTASKRDFFGRVIAEEITLTMATEVDEDELDGRGGKRRKEESKVWCSFREGFSNAVRKPITWDELMAGL